LKIILVDDEQKFVNMLAKRLALRGIEADVAYSGEEAIKMAGNKTYDVAVLDIKMPGISGTQLKKKLHSLHSTLKFVFVTGHGAVDKSEEDASENEIYLSKPMDIELLIETIEELTKAG
jgi:DNA-binding NtrC family response regulator